MALASRELIDANTEHFAELAVRRTATVFQVLGTTWPHVHASNLRQADVAKATMAKSAIPLRTGVSMCAYINSTSYYDAHILARSLLCRKRMRANPPKRGNPMRQRRCGQDCESYETTDGVKHRELTSSLSHDSQISTLKRNAEAIVTGYSTARNVESW